MLAPIIASSPRERVWYPRSETDYVDLRFGYEYFAPHAEDGGSCGASRHFGNVEYDSYEIVKPTKKRVCLQRLGVICYSTPEKAPGNKPADVAIVIEDTRGCPSDWASSLNIMEFSDADVNGEIFTHRFFERVLYFVLRQTTRNWSKLLQAYQSQYMLFVGSRLPIPIMYGC